MKRLICLVMSIIMVFSVSMVGVSAVTNKNETAEAYAKGTVGLIAKYINSEFDSLGWGIVIVDPNNSIGYIVAYGDDMTGGTEYKFIYIYNDYDPLSIEMVDYDSYNNCSLFRLKETRDDSMGIYLSTRASSYTGEAYLLSVDYEAMNVQIDKGVSNYSALQNNIVCDVVNVTETQNGLMTITNLPDGAEQGSILFDVNGCLLGSIATINGNSAIVINADKYVEMFPQLKNSYYSSEETTTEEQTTEEATTKKSKTEETTTKKTTTTKVRETTKKPDGGDTDKNFLDELKDNKKILIIILIVLLILVSGGVIIYVVTRKKDDNNENSSTIMGNGNAEYGDNNYYAPPQPDNYGGYNEGLNVPIEPMFENENPNQNVDIYYDDNNDIVNSSDSVDADNGATQNVDKSIDFANQAPIEQPKVSLYGKGGFFDGKTLDTLGAVYIGRHPQKCNVCYSLEEKGISTVHCKIEKDGDGILLTDLDSSYGTFTATGKLTANVPVHLNKGEIFWLADKRNSFIVQ